MRTVSMHGFYGDQVSEQVAHKIRISIVLYNTICGITSSSDSKKASTDSAYYYSTTTTIKLGINEQKCNALKYDALYINTVGDSGEPCKIYTSTCYTHTTGCAGKELGVAVMLAGSSLAIFRLVFFIFPSFYL